MAKRVAILQSNYIPWKGYFDLINMVDQFILYDTAQFTKNDWRNRNKIKTRIGLQWLTIPVRHSFGQSIHETTVSDASWSQRHWATLSQNYASCPHFPSYKRMFEQLYGEVSNEPQLSKINYRFLTEICSVLGITTPINWSSDFQLADGQTARLVDLCRQIGADEYLSGPAARNYLDESLFAGANIRVSYIDYTGYQEYRQAYPPFEHGVSIMDLIFNEGPEAPRYLKSFRAGRVLESKSGGC